MVFSSLEFLFAYLPITLIAYFAIPHKFLKVRNLILLIVSLAFYGWGEPVYVFIMMFSIVQEYFCGYGVSKYIEKDKKIAKRFVILSVVINMLLLGFFKYYDFFITNLRLIPALSGLKTLGLTLPIGISFYTFQTMSYTLDIYMGNATVQKNITSFGAYVTLFPQLIAGPIVRYQDVDEMLRHRDENFAMFASGVRTFLAGMGKKIFFANMAGALWESYRVIPGDERTVIGCWIGIICYTFQIYFDFSGYSDMAIGLGKMFGFTFLENFNYPYIAKNVTDFWRRWHMSLSTWFREYVYFPLGGSRCSPMRNYFNLFIVWFLTGFWHGASWNYILWGLFYVFVLIIEKAFLLKFLRKLPGFLQHIYSLFVIILGWVLFVFEDMAAGAVYLGNMFGVNVSAVAHTGDLYDLLRHLPFFIILCVASTPYPKKIFYKFYEKSAVARIATVAGGVCIMMMCLAYLVDSTFNPFLYFRF